MHAATLTARNLTRVWGRGPAAQTALAGVDLDVVAGELVAVVGPSGSGKSTLGAIVAGLDRPSSGSVVVGGVRVDSLKEDALAAWRSGNVGVVFQDFHLLPTLTAAENVQLALQLAGVRRGRGRRRAADEVLDRVGLADKRRRLPAQLSGGEQQRVAVARAIVNRPALLVADEPTGSLDQASGRAVFDLLTGLAHHGTAIVMVTHDPELAAAADRTVAMVDGRILARTAVAA
jgi:putative ABC transport system ATP-binding protein